MAYTVQAVRADATGGKKRHAFVDKKELVELK